MATTLYPTQSPQQFNYQFNNTTTLNNAPKEENSILIQNLDRFVTESMLHQKFSEVGEIKQITLKSNKLSGLSLGRALIEFKNENSVKEAVRKFNMRKFFEQNEEVEQKFMEVTQKVNKTKLEELKTLCKLFFKLNVDSESTIINPTEISDYLTIFGDIQQLKFKSKRGKLLNYGSIIFKSKDEKEKALSYDSTKNPTERGFTIQFDEYDSNQQNFNLHVVEHNLINQTIPDDILADKSKKEKERERLQEIIKKDLEQKKIEYQSIFFMIDEGHKKPFFFISVKSRETFQQIQADFESHGASSNIITNRKNPSDQYKNLHLKNLKVQELTKEEQDKALDQFQRQNPNVQKDSKFIFQEEADAILKARIQKDLEAFGFKEASIKITPPPITNKIQNSAGQPKDFQETRQGTLFFPSSEKGIQFMTTYLGKPNVDTIKTWFLNDNPQGRVNILLGQSDYDLYKRAKQRGAQEQYQNFQKQQVQSFIQQQLTEQTQQFNNNNINNESFAAGNRYQFNNRQNSNYQSQSFPSQQNSSSYQNNGTRTFTSPTGQPRQYNNNINPRYNNNNNNNNQGPRFQNGQAGGNYQGQRQNNSNGGAQNQSRPPYQGQGTRPYNSNYNNNNQQAGQPNQGQFQGQQQQHHQSQQQQQQQQQRAPSNINPAGNQPRPLTNTPQQINQSQITQQSAQAPAVMTIDQIRENPDDFVKKPQDLQKSILGQLIYPKVKAKLDERKEDSKILTPKITGMLIDFSVFELEDIIEMIDNQEDLNERIEEALELIKNPTNQK